MRAFANTRFGLLAAAAVACAGVAGLGVAPAPAAAQEGVTTHWEPAEGAGILRINGDEYQIPLDGSLRLNVAGIFMDRGYRSWYHGDALVVRVDQDPPEVEWLDGEYGMTIEYFDGVLYLTPHESTRVCECSQCVPPVVDPVIVNPAPVVYAPRYTSIYYDDYGHDWSYSRYDYDPYHDIYWYERPRSTLFVHSGLTLHSGSVSLHLGSTWGASKWRRSHWHRPRYYSTWHYPSWYGPSWRLGWYEPGWSFAFGWDSHWPAWRSWHIGHLHHHHKFHYRSHDRWRYWDKRSERWHAHRDRDWRDRDRWRDGDQWRDRDIAGDPDPDPGPGFERSPLRVSPSPLRRSEATASALDGRSAVSGPSRLADRAQPRDPVSPRSSIRRAQRSEQPAFERFEQATRPSGPTAASRGSAAPLRMPTAATRSAVRSEIRRAEPSSATIQRQRATSLSDRDAASRRFERAEPATQPRTVETQRSPLRRALPQRTASPQRSIIRQPTRSASPQRSIIRRPTRSAAPQRSVTPQRSAAPQRAIQRSPLRSAAPQRSTQPQRSAQPLRRATPQRAQPQRPQPQRAAPSTQRQEQQRSSRGGTRRAQRKDDR